MPDDIIEKIGDSLFQHGLFNNRVYLIKSGFSDLLFLENTIRHLVNDNGYSKAFLKVPESHALFFFSRGYIEEARIPLYYGNDSCVFLARFFDSSRGKMDNEITAETCNILELAKSRAPQNAEQAETCSPDERYTLRVLAPEDCPDLALLYRAVFASYPFPVHDPDYLEKTMNDTIAYYGIFHDGRLVAASSAEMDKVSRSAEMTDFATEPEYRGRSFAGVLLSCMEKDMRELGIQTCYTIARAVSAGMNITFARAAYAYGGTLVNNTNISGKIESMNVWYRNIPDRP